MQLTENFSSILFLSFWVSSHWKVCQEYKDNCLKMSDIFKQLLICINKDFPLLRKTEIMLGLKMKTITHNTDFKC